MSFFWFPFSFFFLFCFFGELFVICYFLGLFLFFFFMLCFFVLGCFLWVWVFHFPLMTLGLFDVTLIIHLHSCDRYNLSTLTYFIHS